MFRHSGRAGVTVRSGVSWRRCAVVVVVVVAGRTLREGVAATRGCRCLPEDIRIENSRK